jgi:hypothetical protein
MASESHTVTTLTCDNCGTKVTGSGIVRWWRLNQHPKGVDTTFKFGFDLCSNACVRDMADKVEGRNE